MIVSHRHRFIFLRTRKTASTSLELALASICGPDDVITAKPEPGLEATRTRQNLSLPLRSVQPRDVRWALRTRSRPRHLVHDPAELVRRHVGEEVWNGYFRFAVERNPFDRAISVYYWRRPDLPDPEISFGEWVQRERPHYLSNWEIYTIDDHLAVDHLGRYERLEDELEVIADRIGLADAPELPRAMADLRQDRRDYHDVIDETSRRRIEIVCAKELALLGYEWGESGAP